MLCSCDVFRLLINSLNFLFRAAFYMHSSNHSKFSHVSINFCFLFNIRACFFVFYRFQSTLNNFSPPRLSPWLGRLKGRSVAITFACHVILQARRSGLCALALQPNRALGDTGLLWRACQAETSSLHLTDPVLDFNTPTQNCHPYLHQMPIILSEINGRR